MRKILFNINILAVLMAIPLMISCDGSVSYDRVEEISPVISDFSPKEGAIGTVVTITGEGLAQTSSITVGGEEVFIKERISGKQITFVATIEGRTGVIELVTPNGKAKSEAEYVYTYPAPKIDLDQLPESVEVDAKILISGTNFGGVNAIYLIPADGSDRGEAVIEKQTLNEIVFTVPYVASATAKIVLSYFNGEEYVLTSEADAPEVGIVSLTPQVSTKDFSGIHKESSEFTLEGTDLDKINAIKIGDVKVTRFVEQSSVKLVFAIPRDVFKDGETVTTLSILWNDEQDSRILTEEFTVFVPSVNYWENVRTWGQGQKNPNAYPDDYQYVSFFSPETGIAYSNSVWYSDVDPVAYANNGAVCSSANVSLLTKEEYDKAMPYFFFSGVSAGHLQINSPANSNSQLRNFYVGAGGDRLYLSGDAMDYWGTPILTFKYLDPADTDENNLANRVRNKEIEVIDETTFPIDVEANTIGDIKMIGLSGGMHTSVWAPMYEAKTDAIGLEVDAVLMVLYHGLPGPTGAGDQIKYVKRIGFIHITTANIRATNDKGNPRYSDVTYNVYWQKYDYPQN